jgi:hypothetical protein
VHPLVYSGLPPQRLDARLQAADLILTALKNSVIKAASSIVGGFFYLHCGSMSVYLMTGGVNVSAGPRWY